MSLVKNIATTEITVLALLSHVESQNIPANRRHGLSIQDMREVGLSLGVVSLAVPTIQAAVHSLASMNMVERGEGASPGNVAKGTNYSPRKKYWILTAQGQEACREIANSPDASSYDPKHYDELCVRSLLPNPDYYRSIIEMADAKILELYTAKCAGGLSRVQEINYDRTIVRLNADVTFAKGMLFHIEQQDAAEKVGCDNAKEVREVSAED